ncbi:MAG: ABC transporter permease [Dehalococcoidia bacterium]|nr:ABC transporter permease [Dehalococcoidia bacterium]
MQRFILRRLGTTVLALIGATLIIFSLSRLLGDPRVLFLPPDGYGISKEDYAKLEAQLHLDRAVPVQYGYWLGDLLRGNLGRDLSDRNYIGPKLTKRFGPTLKLALAGFILATVVGVPLGVLSAMKRGSIIDYTARTFALLGQTVPVFWVAIVAILVFSVWLRWLPSATMGEGFSIRNYILPTVTLAMYPVAGYVRIVRSAMLDVMDSEYIKLARAKGVGGWAVTWKHAFKNASIAPLTFAGLLLGGFITGSVAVETVFAWPGLARYAVEAVQTNNFTVIAVITLIFTSVYVFANLVIDILYAYVDPRIRYS